MGKTYLEEWLEKHQEEEVVEPELEIVDPHHHLFDGLHEPRLLITTGAKIFKRVNRPTRKMLTKMLFPKATLLAFGVNSPSVDQYRVQELVKDFQGHAVKKTVIVEASWGDKNKKVELQQVTESAKYYELSEKGSTYPNVTVGKIDLRTGKERVAEAIKEHLKVNPKLVGIRHQLAWHSHKHVMNAAEAEKELSRKENFRGGIAALEEAGLSFDIYCYHTQLDEVNDLVQAFPKMQFILDHCGTFIGVGPYAGKAGREKAIKEWEQGISNLAKNSNVVVKLSGLLMPVCGFDVHLNKTPPSSDELVELTFPYYAFVINEFGVDRCMWASNFPVDKVSTSYKVLYNSFKKISNKLNLSQDDKEKLFCKNAERIYKMDE